MKRGLWPVYLWHFQDSNRDGKMSSILWKHNWQEPSGKIFTRQDWPSGIARVVPGIMLIFYGGLVTRLDFYDMCQMKTFTSKILIA
jgi:hypothetical protein